MLASGLIICDRSELGEGLVGRSAGRADPVPVCVVCKSWGSCPEIGSKETGLESWLRHFSTCLISGQCRDLSASLSPL